MFPIRWRGLLAIFGYRPFRQRCRPARPRRSLNYRHQLETLEQRCLYSVSPVGGEVRVNSTTTANQLEAAVAMDDSGDFVVAWSDKRSGNYEIWAERYNAAGVPQGAEFQVNTTAGGDRTPAVAMDADGDFVVVWGDRNTDEIRARRFNAAGTPLDAADFLVSSSPGFVDLSPAVAMDADGDQVVFVWESQRAAYYDIWARSYNAQTGSFTGVDFQVNTVMTGNNREAAVAIDATGDRVVFAWQSYDSGYGYGYFDIAARRYNAQTESFTDAAEFAVSTGTRQQLLPSVSMDLDGDRVVFAWDSNQGTTYDIYARRYDAVAGSFLAAEFVVNSTTPDTQNQASVAVDDDGDFAVSWTSNNQDASGTLGIYVQQYNAAGTAQGGETLVNTTTDDDQQRPALAMNARSDFVAAWDGNVPGDSQGVARQLYRRDPVADGAEFQVNTYTTNHQRLSSIAADDAGNFVVVWQSSGQDGSGYGIYAQRYNAAGVAQAGEFQVNTNIAGSQFSPHVALDDDGDFVVVWHSNHTGTDDVYYRRYQPDGTAQDPADILVNTTTADAQMLARVAMDGAGKFVVTWSSFNQDEANSWGVYAQRYNAAGVAQGGEFQVNDDTDTDDRFSSVAMDNDGDFVIAWVYKYGWQAAEGDIYFQRYNAAGVAQGSVETVTSAAVYQFSASVAMDYDGDFVVTWTSNQNGSEYDIYARRYDAAGNDLGDEFVVNTTTASDQLWSFIGMDDDGDFVITWTADDANYWGVYARRYRATGTAYGSEFQLNTYTTFDQAVPTVAIDADGDFTATWESSGQDGSGTGVYAQRYTAAAAASFRVQVADELASISNIRLAEGQALAAASGFAPVVIASLDSGVDYTHPALYQNIWLNQGEIPPAWLARLADADTDGDGRITFRDLNTIWRAGGVNPPVQDLNGTGTIDAGDLLYSLELGGWADGLDGDGNGYVDDLIGWDIVNNDNDPYDDSGHGTHGAGIVVQVAPNAEIVPLKFLDNSDRGYHREAVAALRYALAQGVPISVAAWTARSFSSEWLNVLLEAQAAGHILVAAAGNNDPAALAIWAELHLDNVLVVTASDAADQLASFSNGDAGIVDVAAPGVGIVSAVPGGGYEARSGSSVAAAFVAGTMGLLRGADPAQHYRAAADALFAGADPVAGCESGSKYGRLNVFAALVTQTTESEEADWSESIPTVEQVIPVVSIELVEESERAAEHANEIVAPAERRTTVEFMDRGERVPAAKSGGVAAPASRKQDPEIRSDLLALSAWQSLGSTMAHPQPARGSARASGWHSRGEHTAARLDALAVSRGHSFTESPGVAEFDGGFCDLLGQAGNSQPDEEDFMEQFFSDPFLFTGTPASHRADIDAFFAWVGRAQNEHR